MKELKRKSIKKCNNISIHPLVEEALQSIEHYLPYFQFLFLYN